MNEEKNPFETPEENEGFSIEKSPDTVTEIESENEVSSEYPVEETVCEGGETFCEESETDEISDDEQTQIVSSDETAPAETSTGIVAQNNETAKEEGSKTSKKSSGNKKKKRILDAILALCIVGLFVSGYFLMTDIIPRIENMKNIKDIQQVSPIIDTETDSSRIPSIEYLKEINKDIIGWINIPNTNVDYPLLQCSNNNYYLQYSYNEKWNDAGSIFLDFENSDDFSDQNTVIYGHARYDGTMFAQVLYYKKQSQYEKAPFITIVLEGKVYYYQIFSANIIPADYDYRDQDYGSKFMDHIKKMRKDSMIKSSAVVDKNSKIITLSTCTNVIDDGRLALLAVLLNPDGEKIDLNDYPI